MARDRVGAEGHGVGVVAQLDAFLLKLVDDAAAVDVAAQEGQDVAPLQLAHDLDRHRVRLGAADDGGEAGHAAVDQLDAPRAQLDVVDRAVQVAAAVAAVRGLGRRCRRPGGSRASGSGCSPVDEAHGLDHLFGEQRGHAAVERLAQVGRPAPVGRDRVQQCPWPARVPACRSPIVLASAPVMPRIIGRIVGRVGEGDRRLGALLGHGALEHLLGFVDDGVGAANGAGGDVA